MNLENFINVSMYIGDTTKVQKLKNKCEILVTEQQNNKYYEII